MLENFLLGINALGLSIKSTILSLIYHPVIIGFAIGFFASTGIHAIIISDYPRYIIHTIAKKLPDALFQGAPRCENRTVKTSYMRFLHEFNRVCIVFYSAVLVFLIVIALAMLLF